MTAPTQQEALAMARKAGFNSSPMYPSSVIVRHSNGSFVDVTSRIEALVAAAYARGMEDAVQTVKDFEHPLVNLTIDGRATLAAAIRNRSKP